VIAFTPFWISRTSRAFHVSSASKKKSVKVVAVLCRFYFFFLFLSSFFLFSFFLPFDVSDELAFKITVSQHFEPFLSCVK
jgi:hypothetical protein